MTRGLCFGEAVVLVSSAENCLLDNTQVGMRVRSVCKLHRNHKCIPTTNREPNKCPERSWPVIRRVASGEPESFGSGFTVDERDYMLAVVSDLTEKPNLQATIAGASQLSQTQPGYLQMLRRH